MSFAREFGMSVEESVYVSHSTLNIAYQSSLSRSVSPNFLSRSFTSVIYIASSFPRTRRRRTEVRRTYIFSEYLILRD